MNTDPTPSPVTASCNVILELLNQKTFNSMRRRGNTTANLAVTSEFNERGQVTSEKLMCFGNGIYKMDGFKTRFSGL
jgi:hypothetical protein